jgi:hypothetical protein
MRTKLNRKFGLIFMVLFGLLGCENIELITGLEGTVYRGPINPVEMEGQVNDAPFSALFNVYNLNDKHIKSFSSNADGKFNVMLAPGDYKIIPDKSAPVMGAGIQVREVSVDPVGITRQDLFFDTGIR